MADTSWSDIISGGANLYGAYTGMQNQNTLSDAAKQGYGMAGGAYNPTMFNQTGVGGTGFSVSSPTNGGPGSISSTLGSMDPMYNQYAKQASTYGNEASGLAATASSGASGAYQSALASIMPQLQQMQGNLLSANNNALFERGQIGSGSYGQNTAGGANNPVNLTTQSLGSGFAQQDLNAITAAQNQGLNFFNSNIQGAGALQGLSQGATNTGLGMIGAENQLGQMPLAYSGLNTQAQLGAGANMASMVKAANTNGNAPNSGTASMLNGITSGGVSNLLNGLGGAANTVDSWLGGSGSAWGDISGLFKAAGGGAATPVGAASNVSGLTNGVPSMLDSGSGSVGGGLLPDMGGGGTSLMSSGGTDLSVPNASDMGLSKIGGAGGTNTGFSGAQGMSAVNAGFDVMNDIKNWQSGATGKDTLMGAKTGWDIGNTFVPGIGGVVGGAIGAGVGAVSSAMGGGMKSQEATMAEGYTKQYDSMNPQQQAQFASMQSPAHNVQYINGLMNSHQGTAGHESDLQAAFGKNNVAGFTSGMTNQINSAIKSGSIPKNATPQQLYQKVVQPWLAKKAGGVTSGSDIKGSSVSSAESAAITAMIGQWQSGQLTKSSKVGVKGQTINIPGYGG